MSANRKFPLFASSVQRTSYSVEVIQVVGDVVK